MKSNRVAGRILDFLTTVLIGWAVLNLQIIKLAESVKRLRNFLILLGICNKYNELSGTELIF